MFFTLAFKIIHSMAASHLSSLVPHYWPTLPLHFTHYVLSQLHPFACLIPFDLNSFLPTNKSPCPNHTFVVQPALNWIIVDYPHTPLLHRVIFPATLAFLQFPPQDQIPVQRLGPPQHVDRPTS